MEEKVATPAIAAADKVPESPPVPDVLESVTMPVKFMSKVLSGLLASAVKL